MGAWAELRARGPPEAGDRLKRFDGAERPAAPGRPAGLLTSGTVNAGFAALVLSLVSSCDAPPAPPHIVRDSAGVEIVESVQARSEDRWRFLAEPSLRLGVVEGEPWEEFSGIAGAVRLESGLIAIADAGSQEVRFFDESGTYLHAVGGEGAGPGEFTGLSGLGVLPGGGLWAYDFTLRRITWMDDAGRITGTTSLGPEPPALHPIGPTGDGRFILKQLWGVAATATATDAGVRRDPVPFVLFDSDGVLLDTIVQVPGREVFLTRENDRGVMTTLLFGRNAVATVRDGRLVVGTQDRFVLDEHDVNGRLTRRLIAPDPELRLSSSEVAQVIERRVESAPTEERPSLRATLEGLPVPNTRPAYGEVRSDRAGRLWVSDWLPGDLGPPSRWRLFDAAGRWIDDVTLPEGLLPLDIGLDWILGVERNELDVEFVVLYRREPG